MEKDLNCSAGDAESFAARACDDAVLFKSRAEFLMNRALQILDDTDEPVAAVHLENALHSIKRG